MVKTKLFLVFIFIPFFAYTDSASSKIIIYGEAHRSQHSEPIQNLLDGLANRGTFYLALEGLPYGPVKSSQTIYGIENSLPLLTNIAVKNYVMLYRSLNNLHGEKPYLTANAAEFISNFTDQDPITVEIWQKVPRPFKNLQDENLALTVDKVLTADNPKDFFHPNNPNVINFRKTLTMLEKN